MHDWICMTDPDAAYPAALLKTNPAAAFRKIVLHGHAELTETYIVPQPRVNSCGQVRPVPGTANH